MQWYYVDDGQPAGPVEETEFPNLVRQGKIKPETLIWRDGWANWEPFSTAAPAEHRTLADQPVAPVTSPLAGGSEAVCAECGIPFPKDDLISHGRLYICANCKPVFMQKLAEGVKMNVGLLNYASVGTRFGALVLDWILLYAVSFILQIMMSLFIGAIGQNAPTVAVVLAFVMMALNLAIGVLYETIMVGKYGATLGKMACKIKVVTASGGRVTYARALGRHFAKLLSGILCLTGYLIALFDQEERRTLHDRMCDTRVVLKQP